jgi:hypothetical protein
MKNISILFFSVVLFVGIPLLLASCVTEEPISIKQFSIHSPNSLPGLARNNLTIARDRVTLRWNQSTDPEFVCYKIYRSPDPWWGADLTYPVWTITKRETAVHIDSFYVYPNTSYFYKIITAVAQGASSADTITIKTLP